MKKRVLSLLLCFVLAAGLLSVCAPPAQAGTIAGVVEQFLNQPDQIKKLFGKEVAHGDCGPAGNEASVHYKIYEVTNPTVVQDNPVLQQIWREHDYREDAQYYGVYIFGNGPMADYGVTGQKAPWLRDVEGVDLDAGETIGEDYLVLAYIAGATDEEWDGRTEHYTGVPNVGDRAFKDCQYLTCMFLDDGITTIGDHAFYADEYLSAINMPRKLELIDKYAFYGCDTLTFVRAGACSRLKRIEDHAFYSCTMLAELRLPNCLTYIGPWAFAWDRILGQEDTTLGLPSSLQVIDTGAFAFVNHHKKLNIPSQVTRIGDYAFRDMPAPGIWAHAGLDYCIYSGYINGLSATTVDPSGTCTRAQLVCILYRIQGEPKVVEGYELAKLRAPFDDVPRGQWYTNAILWAKLTGIVNGTSATTFDPSGQITREQLAAILYRYTAKYAPDATGNAASLAAYPDAGSVSAYARDAMAWAVGNGLIKGLPHGKTDYLEPGGSTTRAQVATILMRYEQATA